MCGNILTECFFSEGIKETCMYNMVRYEVGELQFRLMQQGKYN